MLMEPYLILLEARSSTDEMGVSILSMVRKAARLAVYELIMIKVKNHQNVAMIRVEAALGRKSHPKSFVGECPSHVFYFELILHSAKFSD